MAKRKTKKELEAEVTQLHSDIKKIVNGDTFLALKYRTQYTCEDIMFSGGIKPYKNGDKVYFNGILHKIINRT